MTRRLTITLLILLLAGQAWGWPEGRLWRAGGPWWLNDSLTFWAPFTDPNAPLTLNKGTGSLSFTRATTATYVHPTTGLITTAASGQLRIESNGALIEGQRTNLCLNSEDISGTGWGSLAYATRISNYAVAPDGNITADFIKEDATAGTNHSGPNQAFTTLVDNTIYTFSGYVKPAGRTWILFNSSSKAGTSHYSYFDLSGSGSVGSNSGNVTAAINPAPNGYYRMSVSFDVGTGATYPGWKIFLAEGNNDFTYSGDNTSGVYVWGAQVEAASFPSSYIPTTTAEVTRNGDLLTFPTTGNVAESGGVTIFYQTVKNGINLSPGPANGLDIVIGNYNTNASAHLGFYGSTYSAYINFGATWSLTKSYGSAASNTPYKIAHRIASDMKTFSLFRNGAQLGTNGVASSAKSSSWSGTYTSIGGTATTSDDKFFNIRNLRIWNRALTDAELQVITK